MKENQTITELFIEYISLNNELEKKGGRNAVVDNPNLESLYEKVLDIEDKILKEFGLPKLFEFREIVFNLKTENDFDKIATQLKNEAELYLTSYPKKEVDLLENAKINDLRTYDVLPEIGIEDTLHAMFYFEEYFKKGKIDANELINILKSIDESTSIKFGHLHYYTVKEKNLLKAEKIYNELKERQIPYIEEFRKYRPVYPY